MCANPPPGLQLVTAASEFDSDPASVTATCPTGKNLIGTGGEIAAGLGQVMLDDLRPDASLTNVTVDRARGRDRDDLRLERDGPRDLRQPLSARSLGPTDYEGGSSSEPRGVP